MMSTYQDGARGALKQQMENYYEDSKFETKTSAEKFNNFTRKEYVEANEFSLVRPSKFIDLNRNRVIGLGLYMFGEKALKVA